MKKLLIFMLVLGMASLANATVVQLEVDVAGSISGNYGTGTGDLLVVGDQVKLKVTLTDLDNYPTSPAYDGYVLSTLGVSLNSDADADLYKFTAFATKPKSVLSPLIANVSGGNFTDLGGASIAAGGVGYPAGMGNPIIWNLWLDITTADGSTTIDMVLNTGMGPSTATLLVEPVSYFNLVESDLGDLVLYTVPEPATVALLGLGGLFLLRRRK